MVLEAKRRSKQTLMCLSQAGENCRGGRLDVYGTGSFH
jgi:hypothetical protein